MSKLLGLSFDAVASPQIRLLYTREDRIARPHPYGWGIGWYSGEDRAATIVKDPAAIADSESSSLLRDWSRFRSTVFVCHLRGAALRISQEDTHPFVRSFAGRDWVLTNHGQLQPGFADVLSLGEQPVYQPVGLTDGEHLLCWLLQRARAQQATQLADVDWQQLVSWLHEASGAGSLNVLLTDGVDLIAYRGFGDSQPLHWTRQRPPFAGAALTSDDIEVDFGDVRDHSRTSVLFATEPLAAAAADPSSWTELQHGQMIVARRGAIMWDSSQLHGVPADVVPPTPAALDEARVADSGAGAGAGAAAGTGTGTGTGVGAAAGADPAVATADAASVVAAATAAGPLRQTQVQSQGLDLGSGDAASSPDARIYDVYHSTKYTYDTPIEFSRHVLRLRPAHDRFQEVLSHELVIKPLTAQRESEDVFGNSVTKIEMEGSFAEMEIAARSRVRVLVAPSGELRSPSRTSIPLSWMPWQRQMMLPYLLPIELPEPQLTELFEYAMSFVERQSYDVVETLLDINTSIYRDYAYVQGVTSVETTPFEVYTTRRGVCQDFANLLICLARLLNVPARYRVGYIYTGANYENQLQSDASHAWVEVFLPWIGWRGLDPTNGCVVNSDHVRVACGRHYRDATPTSGTIYRGGGDEKMVIEVRVVPVTEGARDSGNV
tara:strand:- start:9251 stop:11239 length:1989 start_codon:yes stop_codon:yes gene_type:complete